MTPRLYAVATLLALIASAQHRAETYWQATPCQGEIAIQAAPLGTLNAESIYTTADGDPAGFEDCRIVFNSALPSPWSWTWDRFCTVMVHEYGHLLGHQHSPDPADVMYADYVRPVGACRRYQWR
jgi:hypothetical protein